MFVIRPPSGVNTLLYRSSLPPFRRTQGVRESHKRSPPRSVAPPFCPSEQREESLPFCPRVKKGARLQTDRISTSIFIRIYFNSTRSNLSTLFKNFVENLCFLYFFHAYFSKNTKRYEFFEHRRVKSSAESPSAEPCFSSFLF